LRFGAVAAAAAHIKLDAEPGLKPESEWTVLGKVSPGKLNGEAIVTGTNTYGIDVRLPGMLYAAVLQSPVQGGKLVRCDADAVKSMPGVQAVIVLDPSEPRPALKTPLGMAKSELQSAVVVVADQYWRAKKALAALPVEWDAGPGGRWTTASLYEATEALLDK